MSAPRATASSVAEAIEELESRGILQPTVDTVRELTGGSKTTVIRLLREYRANLDEKSEVILTERMEALLAEFLRKACAEATRLARDTVSGERRRLDFLADALDDQSNSLQCERDLAQERAGEAEARVAALETELASSRYRIELDGSRIVVLEERCRILAQHSDGSLNAEAGESTKPKGVEPVSSSVSSSCDLEALEQMGQLNLLHSLPSAVQSQNAADENVV